MTIRDPEHVDEPHRNNSRGEDLRERAEEWLRKNPKAYALFLKFARQMAARNRHFGINLLRERVRPIEIVEPVCSRRVEKSC